MRYLKQSTSVDVGIGPFLDETDGKTAETALTITQPDIRLKKNNGNWAQKAAAQTLSHEENGWYELTLDGTDTDTIGHLLVAIHESGALPVWCEFHVLAANVYDSLFGAATDKLDVNVEEWNTTAVPSEHTAGYPIVTVKDGTGTGEINTTSGRVDADITHIATAAVSTSTAQLGVNVVNFGGSAGTFASGRPEVNTSHIAGSAVSTTSAQIGVNVVQISTDATAADNLEKEYDGTGFGHVLQRTTIATLSSQTSFTLTDGSADNDAYNGCVIVVEDASTAAQKAVGVIADYTGSSKTITLLNDPAVFTMATTDIVTILADRALKATVDNRTLDVSASGEGGLDWANIGSPTTTVNLSGTTVKTATDVETDTQDIQSRLPAALVSGRIDASVGAMAANTFTASAVATDAVTELRSIVTGTADSGTTTTFVDAARTESVADYWKGDLVLFTSGTLAGQCRLITGFSESTDTITFAPATTVAVSTHDYEILPFGGADVTLWRGSVPNTLSGSRVDVDVGAISTDSTAADNAEAFFDGNGYAGTGNVIPTVTTVTNTVNANAVQISGDSTAADNAESFFDGTGYAGTNNVIPTVTSITNAVTVGTLQANTVSASALASDAVDEIWAKAMSELSSVPAITGTVLQALSWLFSLSRNKITQTASTQTIFKDDATTTLSTSSVSDDGTTFQRSEFS